MLSITLEGYGCYRTSTQFNFDGPGLVLIQGLSGGGKSTILNGIAFTLYDKKFDQTSWGESKCKAILRYDGWIVTRTKNPKTLRISIDESRYEGAEAQDMINEKFGQNFAITNYITQDSKETFFNLDPKHRMAFLEKIALGDVNIDEIKQKCDDKIRERKKKLAKCAAELKVVFDEHKLLSLPVEAIFPLPGKYSPIKVENERKRQKKNSCKLSSCRKELSQTLLSQSEYKLQKQRFDQLQSQQIIALAHLEAISSEIDTIPQSDADSIAARIAFLHHDKELVKLRSTYNSDVQQYQAMCVIELAQLQDELDSFTALPILDNTLAQLLGQIRTKERHLRLQSKIALIEHSIEEMDTVDNYGEVISSLQATEQELIEQYQKAKDRTTIHKCPGCYISLRFGKDKLELSTDKDSSDLRPAKDIDIEVKQTRKERQEYETSLYELNTMLRDLSKIQKEKTVLEDIDLEVDYQSLYESHKDALHEQDARVQRISQLKKKIVNEEFDSRTQAIARRIEQKSVDIKRLEYSSVAEAPCELPEKDDLAALGELLCTMRMDGQKRQLLTQQVKKGDSACKDLQRQLDSIVIEECDWDSLIAVKTREIGEIEELEVGFDERRELLTLYMHYLDLLKTYTHWDNRLADAREDENRARQSLSIADRMMRKIKETESAAVMNSIENINHHLGFYLDRFFLDPIQVEISSFKEVKSTGESKPEINIQVVYKGCECKLNELSGGERARVELSICLAINSVAGGSLLLFDEVMKSLDSDASSDIIEVLKGLVIESKKLIIMICHQPSTGDFDSVVSV